MVHLALPELLNFRFGHEFHSELVLHSLLVLTVDHAFFKYLLLSLGLLFSLSVLKSQSISSYLNLLENSLLLLLLLPVYFLSDLRNDIWVIPRNECCKCRFASLLLLTHLSFLLNKLYFLSTYVFSNLLFQLVVHVLLLLALDFKLCSHDVFILLDSLEMLLI